MTLKLHELTNEDEFKLVVDIEHEAYSNPFNGVWEITKGSSTEECCARQFSWHRNDSSSHWIYVTDEASGDVIGGTQWHIHETNPYAVEQPMRTAYWWPEGPMKQIGDQLIRDLRMHRPGHMSKPHLLISYCFVGSMHRNRGAASLMLKWGLEKADDLGLDTFVESTEVARRTYEKHGFNVIGDLDMDAHLENPSEDFNALRERLGCPIHGWIMKREAQKKHN
ncbi:hypothetical protein F5B20DRAFT_524032 [Whalleya microplaca]|nr:hypothetical protein F5B20DRAFT_524032 [Whalleya microplaca]